jgi:hypothetical protein
LFDDRAGWWSSGEDGHHGIEAVRTFFLRKHTQLARYEIDGLHATALTTVTILNFLIGALWSET